MILQRDRRLNEEINRFGCYFMCLLFIANKLKNYAFSAGKIEELYDYFVMEGWMDEDCYVTDPVAILNFLGVKVRSASFTENMDIEAPWEVLYWERVDGHGKVIPHFTVGNGRCVTTYDPWGVSRTATEGTLKSRRIFT